MLWIGHIALGYILFRLFDSLSNAVFTANQQVILLIIALVASVLPDLDFIPFFINNKSMKLQSGKSHRGWTHAPGLYVLVAVVLLLIFQNPFLDIIVGLALISVLGHFVGDSIEYGVPWLWPFSGKRYKLHEIPPEKVRRNVSTVRFYWVFFNKIYIKNYTFYLDLLCILVAGYLSLFT